MILDPEQIPSEIKDQIEAAGNSLGFSAVWLVDGQQPTGSDQRVLALSEAFQRALTALAMMILS
jgi:hypothetical protein